MVSDDGGAKQMTEEMNPYLARRMAKIAENEKRLRDLGLLSHVVSGESKSRRITASPVSHQQPTNRTRSFSSVARPVRRSKRLRKESSSSNSSHQDMRSTSAEKFTEAAETTQGESTNAQENDNRAIKPSGCSPISKTFKDSIDSVVSVQPNSARAIEIDVNRLLFGIDPTTASGDGMLGKQLSKSGKAFVMEESARLAARSGCEEPSSISFNKYSGVQEWKNDVLFLWVNLNAPPQQCDVVVVNEFPHSGRQITWFGGSRMHDQSPVIQRLIRVGNRDHTQSWDDNGITASFGIVLWCRRFVQSKKNFSPYVCLGRLSYSSHEPGSRPLSFVWNLVDYEKLVDHPDTNIRASFHEIVKAASSNT